ncbi:MAG: glycosyltransferase [Candidatus Magnetoovum sp. WYHC-5]|nr:glycosyltransferase [Candidatus Magnetoovum sp. WYHC-5]
MRNFTLAISVLSIIGILSVFIFNFLLVWIIYVLRGERRINESLQNSQYAPSMTMIVVVRNGEDMIINKIENALSLTYPNDNFEIIIYSDGSTDKTESIVEEFIKQRGENRVKLLTSAAHMGKINGMNEAVLSAKGEVLIFSDVDALINKEAPEIIVKHLLAADVGGICGLRTIYEENKATKDAQSAYISFDSYLKILESRIGSISSNEGKLYAIKRDLYKPIPPAVTDDLFVCMSVVEQGYRFVFDKDAKAYIKLPSRSAAHEIQRRRRIVSTSLKGIYIKINLLNPYKYGTFAFGLLMNKVMRRFLPVFMIVLFLCSMVLASYNSVIFLLILILQVLFYGAALTYWGIFEHSKYSIPIVTKVLSIAYYFTVGNYGTLRGLIDFLFGREITRWTPIKND